MPPAASDNFTDCRSAYAAFNLRRSDTFVVHPDVGSIPQRTPAGTWKVDNYCPGEYCRYKVDWKLLRGVTIRREPSLQADSIGFVPPTREVFADTGFALVDPPGIVIITAPPPALDFATYQPPFAVGDTVVVLSDRSEGYWNVVWRKCITVSYGYWDERGARGARVVREPFVHWWVHAMPESGREGWILMNGVSFRFDERDE